MTPPIQVNRIDAQTWKTTFSENAHLIAFKKNKPAWMDRIDFALLTARGEVPLGYVTCREFDAESLYWQYGGAFPSSEKSILSWRAYEACANWCKGWGYKRITTLIENDNTPMLKMALTIGFRAIGVRLFGGKIYVEHLLELAQ